MSNTLADELRLCALADWLDGASAWMTNMVDTRADYPNRRHRPGEMYPVRFRAGELDAFLAGLETAAGAVRAMAGPLPSSGLPAPPVTRALPAGWRVVK